MKKPTKILLAIATVLPLLYMIFFVLVFFSSFLFFAGGSEEGGAMPILFLVIFPLHLLTMLLILGLNVIYIVNVFRNDRVEKDKKALWAVVLFMGNMFAFPVYWYLYIWREPPPPDQSQSKQLSAAAGGMNRIDVVPSSRKTEYVPPSQPPDWR